MVLDETRVTGHKHMTTDYNTITGIINTKYLPWFVKYSQILGIPKHGHFDHVRTNAFWSCYNFVKLKIKTNITNEDTFSLRL